MSWEAVRLGEVCTVLNGFAFKSIEFKDEGIPLIRISNINNNSVRIDHAVNVPSEYLTKYSKFLVKRGDILVALSGATTGKYGIYDSDESALLNQRVGLLRPKNNSVDTRYIYHYLNLLQKEIETGAQGAAQPNISTGEIANLFIPFGSITVQKRIADILDKADNLRKKDKQLLQYYDDLAQSLFIDMFGDPVRNEKNWCIKTLAEISTYIVDCPHTTPKYIEMTSQYPCIRTSELVNGQIKWESMKYVDEAGFLQRIKALQPQFNDVIYGREGSFGEAVLVPLNTSLCLGQRTMLFRPDKTVANPIFFWFQLRSDAIYNQALRQTKGSTVGHINVGDIKKFKAVVPPLALQNQFAKQIQNIEQQKEKLKVQMQESEKLFQALLQKAFNGVLN
ncbi:type I restriction enzyme, S subunit [Mucilaginibacter gossypiicola]|uniref:Type I restriction enzyme, S subunit n=1 Tax=Mucilaginibacter gossypiicola TaxID=551995 RepID=A0A1H8RFE1_9SPHI|nr:restriction endonuclease subunit S [Mucilaginibacter gossypiicola]SEO65259.1 type I restriction enzyme, S subunit [Mucilaginibacter gossypiicola]